jgi:hypothetical protein
MAQKKKKHVLTFEEEFPFQVLGIISSHPEYRLVWAINSELDFKFEAGNPHQSIDKKTKLITDHPLYFWEDQEERTMFHLIKNKVGNKVLFPEKPSIDYFLIVVSGEDYEYELTELTKKLKLVESILGVYEFDPEEFESLDIIDF